MGEVVIPDHKLIHLIAEGGYGEVWLVQSVSGSWRAAKIIHHGKFKNPRPFEREYNGVKDYEPISREHENLVDILHVGRNDEEGYFYYIMELADNLQCKEQNEPLKNNHGEQTNTSEKNTNEKPFDVTSYQPDTLENELKLCKKLNVKDCVQVGISIAKALHFLHSHGLVHRDVKPSNILRVNGVYKLADVGLVTHTCNAQSFVGTEGYFPPEGPGSISADLYALGKVLYEIATGHDRLEFPNLPTLTYDSEESALLMELNYIILKACHPDPSRRYSSASEMVAELEYIYKGGSLKQLRAKKKRIRMFVGVCCLLLTAFVGFGAYYNHFSGFVLKSSISVPGIPKWYHAVFAQLNKDSGLEIAIPVNNQVMTMDRNGVTLTHPPIAPAGGVGLLIDKAIDINNDGIDELVVTYTENTNCILQIVSMFGYKFREFQAFGTNTPRGISMLFSGGFIEKPDGKRYFISAITTPYPKKPRGIYCFDFETEQPLWFFPTAPFFSDINLLDLDGDGILDVLLTTGAPCNGAELEDGTDDCHSYVYGISSEGNLLWRLDAGDEYTHCQPIVIDADRDGEKDIYILVMVQYFFRGKSTRQEYGVIYRLKPNGEVVAKFESEFTLWDFTVGDLNNCGKDEIIVSARNGDLIVLDPNLRIITRKNIRKLRYNCIFIDNLNIKDFDGDGKNELFCRFYEDETVDFDNPGYQDKPPNYIIGHDVSLLMLNNHLNIISKKLISKREVKTFTGLNNYKIQIKDFYGIGKPQIIVLDNKLDIYEFKKPILGEFLSLF